jgi:hypothetical protein
VDLGHAARGDREVPVVPGQARVDAGYPRGEPGAVARRDHQVLVALPEQDGDRDVGQREAPVGGEGEVVVHPPVPSGGDGVAHRGGQILCVVLRQHGRSPAG